MQGLLSYFVASGNGLDGLSHYEVESAGTNLAKATVAAERYGDGYRRIVPLEFHSAGDEQIVEFVHVERSTCLTKQQCAGLSYRPVAKSIAHRLKIVVDRGDAAMLVGIEISDRTFAPKTA